MKNYDYSFSLLEPYIIGGYKESCWFSFDIYTNHAPTEGAKPLLNEKIYSVLSVVDDTDSEEFGEGLSYSKVTVELI